MMKLLPKRLVQLKGCHVPTGTAVGQTFLSGLEIFKAAPLRIGQGSERQVISEAPELFPQASARPIGSFFLWVQPTKSTLPLQLEQLWHHPDGISLYVYRILDF